MGKETERENEVKKGSGSKQDGRGEIAIDTGPESDERKMERERETE